jgi:hypothetical protein
LAAPPSRGTRCLTNEQCPSIGASVAPGTLASVSAEFRDLSLASAGAAGSLIGLLFVAVTIAHERLSTIQVSRVRASAALTAFLNALAVSLFALVPGIGIGWTALVVSVSGLSFVVAALLSLQRVRRSQPSSLLDAAFLVGLAVTLVIQLSAGVTAILHPHETNPVQTIAILVIVCFLIGIARSWELIGGPSIGLGGELADIARAGWRERGDEPSGST